jgi:hypothetical protein
MTGAQLGKRQGIRFSNMKKDFNTFLSRKEWLKYFQPKGLGIEIGVERGWFSKVILETCPNLKLFLLDCWDYPINNYHDRDVGSLDEQLKIMAKTFARTRKYNNRVSIIKGYSDEYAKIFPDNFFDFIYIDANHKYEEVKKDLELWYPKLKSSGLFSGHDYLDRLDNECDFGVKSAVDEFGKNNNLEIYATISSKVEEFPTWFCFKP